jgi:hypothetical protein
MWEVTVHPRSRLFAIVSASADRLVATIWPVGGLSVDIAAELEGIRQGYAIGRERPDWCWQQGNDLLHSQVMAGNPLAKHCKGIGIEHVYAWHLTSPGMQVPDPELVKQLTGDILKGYTPGERN